MRADSNFFFFPEYACSFEKSGFGFLLRAAFVICCFNEAFLTRHQHCFLVPVWGCTITVVQFFQLCSRLLTRFAESVRDVVGVDVQSWSEAASSTVQVANSLYNLCQGLLQTVQWFSSIELLLCCNLLPSTSTQHVLVSMLFQVIASSQTSTSLFHLVWGE